MQSLTAGIEVKVAIHGTVYEAVVLEVDEPMSAIHVRIGEFRRVVCSPAMIYATKVDDEWKVARTNPEPSTL